jgi:hypothetical protein
MKIHENLIDYLILAEESKTITSFDDYFNLPLTVKTSEIVKMDNTHKGILELYTKVANGFSIKWKKKEGSYIDGSINFVPAETIFQDWNYDEWEAEQNENIQYFKPFDLFVGEAECGFIIKADEVYPSIYYRELGEEPILYSLDLDFNGYCQMAVEARIYVYWQEVILNIQGVDRGQSITEKFKKDMPEIFPDFSWDNFVQRYNSLRLSNQK